MSAAEIAVLCQNAIHNATQNCPKNKLLPRDVALQVWRTQASLCSAAMDSLSDGASPDSQDAPHVAYVLDIEGTTTPLPFVTKVLYPASEAHLDDFLASEYPNSKEVSGCVAQCPDDAVRAAVVRGDNATVRSVFARHLRNLIAQNSKAAYLKVIQGLIWQTSYESGRIKGHLFHDAAAAVTRWGAASNRRTSSVWIYSSGSIAAQKLLFRHSSHGDLTPYLSGYFDPSTVGSKQEPASFIRIRDAIAASHATASSTSAATVCKELRIVFLTDSLAETRAASAAQCINRIVLMTRPLNAPLDAEETRSVFEAPHEPERSSTPLSTKLQKICSGSSFEMLDSSCSMLSDDDSAVESALAGLQDEVKIYKAAQPSKLKSFL